MGKEAMAFDSLVVASLLRISSRGSPEGDSRWLHPCAPTTNSLC